MLETENFRIESKQYGSVFQKIPRVRVRSSLRLLHFFLARGTPRQDWLRLIETTGQRSKR